MMADVLLELSVAASSEGRRLAEENVRSVLHAVRLVPEERSKMVHIAGALNLVFSQYRVADSPKPVTVAIRDFRDRMVVDIVNRALPLLSIPDEYSDLTAHVLLQNLGREGQTLSLTFTKEFLSSDCSDVALRGKINFELSEVTFRPLDAGEMERVSEIFWRVYEYNYINDLVYYPDKLRELFRSGQFISHGAFYKGKIIGHLGLVQWNPQEPVWEAALGVTDPAFKSGGIFRTLFEEIAIRGRNISMAFTFYDCVCNHDLSQRLIVREGGIDTALFVGCQSASRQAKLSKIGLGEDPKGMLRYSLLYMVLKQRAAPFGKQVFLPLNIGEKIGFVLDELGITWIPSTRFSGTRGPNQGQYLVRTQPEQQAVYFDFLEPGFGVINQLLSEWKDFLRDGFEYCCVDIPIESSSLGVVHNYLCENGFFISGFVPYRNSTRLAVRLQSLAPTRVAFDEIKVFSPLAQKLRESVRQDFERNVQT